jgi:AcrR family transcriptional regulator
MEPQNRRSRRTETALLEAAREIIEDRGLGALTMGSVAELAGVTRRSVYLRFESRTHLLTALFDHVNEQEDLAASVRPVSEAPDAAGALAAWAIHVAGFHPRILRVARAVQSMKDTDPDAAEHWRLVQEDWHRLCLGLAGRIRDEGALAPGWTVERTADMLHALMSLDVLETLVEQRGWSVDEFASHLARVAQSALTSRG